MFGKPGCDLDPRKSGGRLRLRGGLSSPSDYFINIRLSVVNAHGFTQQREHAAVFSGDDGNAYIDIGQQVTIMVVERAGDLAHVARAAEFERWRERY